ncbi:hypothetical protein ONS95_006168 [Cadophora gregata]|uniref:uncharacterized protein n=1 Tax=Cadophora gregata TaxID=51156 RepID=UPI0026DD8B85|nr:uncharacterized protein ONS95_006168 [Cadophora gregata]KAK0102557.1 hypothetical protein ONS95_006168 [Cadophora gregata]
MAVVLRDPWIHTVVENELRAAFQSFQHSYTGQPELLQDKRCCRPSGVEIHIERSRQAQVMQIKGGLTSQYDAILSDGCHCIQAVFDRDAVEKFTRDTGRDLGDIRGGIVVLRSYHLLVPPSSSSTRLCLSVLSFKFSGSEGSLIIGHPVKILELQNVKILAKKLENLLNTPQDNSQTQLSSLATSEGKGSQRSAGFATQVNTTHQKRSPSPIQTQESITTDQAKFAVLLAQVSRHPEVTMQKHALNITQKTALGPASERKVATMNSRLDARANVQRSQSLTPLDSCSHAVVSSGLTLAGSDLPNQAALPDINEKENSQKRAENQDILTSQLGAVTVQHHTTDFVDQLQLDNAFVCLKRVPRRYVRIPEDQRAILQRSDSWYEPHAGDQPRYANVPAKVMKDLIEFRDWKPTRPRLQRGYRDDSSSNSGKDSGHDPAAERVDDDLEGVDSSWSYTHHDSVDQRAQHDSSLPVAATSAECDIASSGPEIEHVADGSDGDMEEDGVPSWEPTPEPEEGASEPHHTETQLPSTKPGECSISCKPRGELNIRPSVNILPSSPTIEEEMELAVPYAVGDIVDLEDAQAEEAAMHSQALPSTAPSTSTYIQVKRTPYVKSRSFDESSLHPTASGSRGVQINVSSSPVIPATFQDTSSAENQTLNVIAHASAGAESIAGTQISREGYSVAHGQPMITRSQNIIITNSQPHTEDSTDKVIAEKPSVSPPHETHRQWTAKAQPFEINHRSSSHAMGESTTIHSGCVSPFPKLSATASGYHVERQIQYKEVTLKGNVAQMEKHAHVASRRNHLTKGLRKIPFFGLEAEEGIDDRPKDELLLEERRRARDAKRNFKAKEQLTRQSPELETETARRPSSPALDPGLSKFRKSIISEADLQSPIRILLSPTPDSPTEVGEPDDFLEYEPVEGGQVHNDQSQDDNATTEKFLPGKPIKQDDPLPLEPSGIEFYEQCPLQKVAACESGALATPPRKPPVQLSPRDSFRPESPSSAQPMADEEHGPPSSRDSLGPGTLSSAQPHPDDVVDLISGKEHFELGSPFAQSQAEEDDHQQPLEESAEVTDSCSEKSQHIENIENSPSRPASQPFHASPFIGKAMDENLPGKELQAENPMPVKPTPSHARPQAVRQVTRSQTVQPNIARRENQEKKSGARKDQQSKDLTFDGFVSTYPEYSGDQRCFARALVCLEWLRKNRIPPWSMCDDFIRVHAEWEPYVRNLKKSNPEKVTTAWEYYDQNVEDTLFNQRFVDDKDKLAAVLSSLNPLYVQTIRDAYNTPAAHPEDLKKQEPKPKAAEKVVYPASAFPESSEAVAVQRGVHHRPNFVENISSRRPRDPFFETASQLQAIQQREETDGRTDLVMGTEVCDEKKRPIPSKRSSETRDPNASPSQSRRESHQSEPEAGSTKSKKRRQFSEHKRVTVPPALRASSSKSSIMTRMEQTRPVSRAREVFETQEVSPSEFQTARLSPELPDLPEKWVAQQSCLDDPVEEDRPEEMSSVPRTKAAKGPVAASKESGLSSKADSPMPSKKRRFKDLAEFAKDLGNRRRSGDMSSRASTPSATTPTRRFCTKPKGEHPAKRVDPDTQAWQY